MNRFVSIFLLSASCSLAMSVSAGDDMASEKGTRAPQQSEDTTQANSHANQGDSAAMQAGDQPSRGNSARRSEEQIMQEECEGKSGKLLADCQTQVHLDYQSGNIR